MISPILEKRFATRLAIYIESNLAQPLLIGDLTTHFGISKQLLKSVVFRTSGLSPHQYILKRRLKKAGRLLTRTDLPIKTICRECGLGEVSQFTKTFHRHFNMPPATYRNRGYFMRQPSVDVSV